MNLESIRKIPLMRRITKPTKMGRKLLILATSDATRSYFENVEVRHFFEEYDVAFLNKMLICSEKEAFLYKPKYFIFLDDIFFAEDFDGKGKGNERREIVEEILERVDWECFVVVPFLSGIKVRNARIHFIYLNSFSTRLNGMTYCLMKKNIFNPGLNNVVMGAIYYGITFKYEDIALLGFEYSQDELKMAEDGLHVRSYKHYYDNERPEEVIPNEEIMINGKSYIERLYERSLESYRILTRLADYASKMGVVITNYTKGNSVDMFTTKNLPV